MNPKYSEITKFTEILDSNTEIEKITLRKIPEKYTEDPDFDLTKIISQISNFPGYPSYLCLCILRICKMVDQIKLSFEGCKILGNVLLNNSKFEELILGMLMIKQI